MRKMTVKRRCAMILVMSSDYRDSCMPYPQEIIDKTHHKLPIIANKRNEDLLTIIKVIKKIFLKKNNRNSIYQETVSCLGLKSLSINFSFLLFINEKSENFNPYFLCVRFIFKICFYIFLVFFLDWILLLSRELQGSWKTTPNLWRNLWNICLSFPRWLQKSPPWTRSFWL